MEKLQPEKSATREKVQHEKSGTCKECKTENYNMKMEIMQLGQSTAKKECNTKKGQHEKSATLKKMQHEKILKKKSYGTRVKNIALECTNG